ncbi:MAG TPA: hypothetical protein VMD29_00150, partial [Terracidiphilus sp.]|nr:hypothetical protein [Terracidiphilus sp.]
MRDVWYGDHRDLAKWGTLVELARRYRLQHILQVLYFRQSEWAGIELEGERVAVSEDVIRHFRNVNSICELKCGIPIQVL